MSSTSWNIQTYWISGTILKLKIIQVAEILIINTNYKVGADKDETSSQLWQQLEWTDSVIYVRYAQYILLETKLWRNEVDDGK
jgi:hypothetical protein